MCAPKNLAHKALHPNLLQRDDGSVDAIGGGGFIPAPRHRQLYAGARISRSPRTERYKYIHYTKLSGMDELYDLRSDPYEMSNVIGAPAARSVLLQMQQELPLRLHQTK